jgi:hypothetical protein
MVNAVVRVQTGQQDDTADHGARPTGRAMETRMNDEQDLDVNSFGHAGR